MAISTNYTDVLNVPLGNNIYQLCILPWPETMDMEALTVIDYSNILGEILTFSVVLNRVGLLKAEVDAALAEAEMTFEIQKAELAKKHRGLLSTTEKKPTEDMIKTAVILDDDYIIYKLEVINAQRLSDKITSIYWACKDKSDKLNRLTDKLRPQEFEADLLSDTINNVLIKKRDIAIKSVL